MKRHDPEQLNTPAVSEEYRLEDIMREFGAKPEPPKEIIKEQTLVFKPIRTAPKDISSDAPVKIAVPKAASLPDQTEPDPTRIEGRKQETAAEKPPKAASFEEDAQRERRPKSAKPVTGKPLHSYTPKEILALEQKGFSLRLIRTALMYPLALLALITLCCFAFWKEPADFFCQYATYLALGVLLISLVLCYEVLLKGLQDILRMRISLYTLSIPVSILCILHTVLQVRTPEDCYVPCVVLLFFSLQRSITLSHRGFAQSLHSVGSFTAPMGIFDAGQVLPNSDSLRRDHADVEDYIARLIQPDMPQTALCLYATFLLPLSCGFAFLLSHYSDCSFIQAWLLLLLGAMPLYAALAYPKPFSALALKLSRLGGALCGWHSARTFGKKHTIILRDEDLFPTDHISSNGMKLYGTYRAERVIAYAHAALAAAENPLVNIFEELLRSESATALTASTYRFYDNNGMGADILGDSVLVGNLSFMRSMGVHMPEGAKVRQAVYVAIGGELAGIFAIKYKANASSKIGLRNILSNRNFSLVLAARDFLISPELIAQKYELPTDTLLFPSYPERIRLSEADTKKPSAQGALISKDSFSAFAGTVSAGHALKLCAYAALGLSLLAGIGGLLLCGLFLLRNTSELISPVNLGIYQLLWASVTWLVSLILRKL